MNSAAFVLSLTCCVLLGCNRPSEPVPESKSIDASMVPHTSDTKDASLLPAITIAPENTRLQTYFERYCDYTGGMGIGFVASHTYDHQFRQHLKKSEDFELKRLFVLQHLYRELDDVVSDYQDGRIRVGKVEYREMSDDEKLDAKNRIIEMLDDLTAFNPDDPGREIADNRAKLK